MQAGRGLDRELPPNTRAIVLPGQIFAYYKLGRHARRDPAAADLHARSRCATRRPYSDLHAVDLLTTVDDLVQQRRLFPGELTPLLRLMGVGAVVTGTDDDISRSGAIDPAAAAGVLAGQGLGTAVAQLRAGAAARRPPPATSAPGSRCPRSAATTSRPGRGIVHVDPPGRRRSSTAARSRWPTWPRSARCPRATRSSTPAT